MADALITGATRTPYNRRPSPGSSTAAVLAQAVEALLFEHDLSIRDIDGLGVASFTLGADRAIDLGWSLGMELSWIMDDGNGGASSLNLLLHALRAVEADDASAIVLVAGDVFGDDNFNKLADGFNETTKQWLAPLDYGGPNALFALLTQRHMAAHALGRETYGGVAVAQRGWALRNPGAVYRSPLSLDDYLAAPVVASPLCIYDCVPVVSGADAILVTAADRLPQTPGVRVKALVGAHNVDHQEADGLTSGLASVADELWSSADMSPAEIDLISIYDDYPVMVLIQLADLGFIGDGDVAGFVARELGEQQRPLNTSGGQLSAGQAGIAGSAHGLVETVQQLRGTAGEHQLDAPRTALVTGYGMALYRYCACANAAVLEIAP